MVSWTVSPLRSGFGSSSRTSLPRAVSSTRCPPGWPRSVLPERLFKPFLADLEAGDEQQRVLVLFLIFLGGGRADIADQVRDRGAVRIEAAEKPRCGCDARQFGQADGDRGIFVVRDILGDLRPAGSRASAFRSLMIRSTLGRQLEDLGEIGRRLAADRSSCSGMRSTRKSERLIAIGLPLRSTIQPRRGGTRISWTRLLSDKQLVMLVLAIAR